jgi:hypothetical protein
VANNSAATGPDLYGRAKVTFSLIGNTAGATLDPASANNRLNRDPRLAPLADNGGPTWTHALRAGSPAIDAGTNPAGLTFDQRGSGFARVSGKAADIGAVEAQGIPAVVSVAVNGGAAQRSRVTDVTVTFNTVVTFAAAPAAAFDLIRGGPGGPTGTVTLAVDLSGSTATQTVARLTFAGALTESGSLIDGNYVLAVLGSQVGGTDGPLDGDGDGAPGGDSVTALYRLYGDVNGDRRVDAQDLFRLRTSFPGAAGGPGFLPDFDWNNDGVVDALDLFQFRRRFGTALTP